MKIVLNIYLVRFTRFACQVKLELNVTQLQYGALSCRVFQKNKRREK
jgi:hypothetical protein